MAERFLERVARVVGRLLGPAPVSLGEPLLRIGAAGRRRTSPAFTGRQRLIAALAPNAVTAIVAHLLMRPPVTVLVPLALAGTTLLWLLLAARTPTVTVHRGPLPHGEASAVLVRRRMIFRRAQLITSVGKCSTCGGQRFGTRAGTATCLRGGVHIATPHDTFARWRTMPPTPAAVFETDVQRLLVYVTRDGVPPRDWIALDIDDRTLQAKLLCRTSEARREAVRAGFIRRKWGTNDVMITDSGARFIDRHCRAPHSEPHETTTSPETGVIARRLGERLAGIASRVQDKRAQERLQRAARILVADAAGWRNSPGQHTANAVQTAIDLAQQGHYEVGDCREIIEHLTRSIPTIRRHLTRSQTNGSARGLRREA